ncbi:hypothetical protein ANANG_G00134210 [Anguilla anguilla]|uniref:Pericentriolar material 1 protein C-terminal domain-containing protein n=1 Tax=Anguilla anguilla TaxID=7936 RepID=A0A9D3RVT5_ANGAN|nr:hypothetical protein ANANG_G00134210 [Anguilla anguilla]
MATGGPPFDCADEQELPNWTVGNGSLEDRLNNMDWDVPQKKANRSSEKNKKKFSAVVESRLTNDISPESTPGAGRRRARTPHSYPQTKYTSQMSVPEQAELDRLKQRINFTDLDERSIGSDSQGRVTAANNQRQVSENKKAFNFLPLHVNTNKSRELAAAAGGEDSKKQGAGRDIFSGVPRKDALHGEWASLFEDGTGEPGIDSSQVVSRLVQIREYISMACCMRDDLVEKNDIPANVEHLTQLIDHLKEQEKSCLKFLQKLLARENDEDDIRTIDSAVGSGSVAESTSLNIEVHSGASDTTEVSRTARYRPRIEDNLGKSATPEQGRDPHGEAREELENLRKQHDLLKRMLQQQEQLRALQGRQAALLAMQQKAEQAIAVMDDTVVTETTGSVSGISITSELNEELNDLIQRFHNQLHDSQTKAVPDNRRQAQSLSLTREVSSSRNPPGGDPASLPCAQLTKLQELQDKKQTVDKILAELRMLRDHALYKHPCQSAQAPPREVALHGPETDGNPAQKLKKLKEVHKRLNELRELVHYYEQTSDMMVDTVNENVKDEETEDDSIFEPMFDSEQENLEPVTNIRNPQRPGNWTDMNSLTGAHGNGNQDGRLNTNREINNRSAANLRSFNIPRPGGGGSGSSGDSRRSSREEDPEFLQKVERLRSAKEKLRHLQQLVAMVQSDDTDETTANASSVAEDEDGVNQRPNNTRAAGSKPQKDLALTEKEREKFYESKLKQQQQELKHLHDERQRLMDIKGEIQDLHWACSDLQNPAPTSQAPAATSTPAANARGAALNRTVEPTATAAPTTRHQILREHLRQRRKHLESLMEEHQRRSVLSEPPQEEHQRRSVLSDPQEEHQRHSVLSDPQEEHHRRHVLSDPPMEEHQRRSVLNEPPQEGPGPAQQASQRPATDERMMAAWGGSSPGVLDEYEDDVMLGVEPGLEEEEEADSSSSEELPSYSSRKRRSLSTRKSQDRSLQTSNPRSASRSDRPSPRSQQEQRSMSRSMSRRRQENPRWASELSFLEEKQHWQEQIARLQKQLDFSTSVCQTLMQDQQALSYILPSLMTAPYSMLPGNVGSPQVHVVMHQLNQCYAQLAWQQSNVQRLKQVLNDLQRQQQQQSQPAEQSTNQEPSPAFSPSRSPIKYHQPAGARKLLLSVSWVQLQPPVPPGRGGVLPEPRGPGQRLATAGRSRRLRLRHARGRRLPTAFRELVRRRGQAEQDEDRRWWLCGPRRWQSGHQPGAPWHGRHRRADPETWRPAAASQGPRRQTGGGWVAGGVPDPSDPATVAKTFRSKKASAQAVLASKDKTSKVLNRKRRGKALGRKPGVVSGSVSSASDYGRGKGPQSRETERPESILDKLTKEKLGSKPKAQKSKELSSAYAWRTPFLSNRIACTEVQDTSSDFSLFEALRETIYSEVASLISQNESRPHFLIELFHELQLLNTDYLRQRALFALQDIVSRHLTEKDVGEEAAASLSSPVWAASNSDLTPSESLATSDGDVSEKNVAKALYASRSQNDGVGSLDNESTLSTSSILDPFASDDLGNTVIHLDKALARIRSPSEGQNILGQMFSGVRCPQIDTQQLDRQIKAIMSEVLPFLQEHMDDVCSTQLLTSIRRMVMTLTQQNDESKEFVRFFHKQLGSILQESLSRFCGRPLRECGEDLLVAISETLFNELAFFRLMQDLDGPRRRFRKRANAMIIKNPPEAWEKKLREAQPFSAGFHDEDKDRDDTEKGNVANAPETKDGPSGDASEREEEDEEDDDSEGLPLSIHLSKAETQPLTNYGSGEDENEDEELEEFEAGPVDVQTSMQASSEPAGQQEQKRNGAQADARRDAELGDGSAGSSDVTGGGAESAEEERGRSERGGPTLTASAPVPEATPTSSPNTDSPVMINEDEVGSGNLSQKSDEDDFVKVEDLPLQLAVLSEEELKRTAEEQQPNRVSPGEPGDLLGNTQTVKEPETVGAQSA